MLWMGGVIAPVTQGDQCCILVCHLAAVDFSTSLNVFLSVEYVEAWRDSLMSFLPYSPPANSQSYVLVQSLHPC